MFDTSVLETVMQFNSMATQTVSNLLRKFHRFKCALNILQNIMRATTFLKNDCMFSAWLHIFKVTHLTGVPGYFSTNKLGVCVAFSAFSDHYFLQNTKYWSLCVQPSLIFVHIHLASKAQFFLGSGCSNHMSMPLIHLNSMRI